MRQPLPPVPTPPTRPLSLLAAIRVARTNTLAVIPAQAFEKPVLEQSLLMGRSFLVSDPEGVQRVLVDAWANYPKAEFQNRTFAAAFGDGILTSEGEVWRRHRRMMAPAFEHRRLAAYEPMMRETAAEIASGWRAGDRIDVAQAMADISLRIIARAMFSGAGERLGPWMDRTLREMDAVLGRFGWPDLLPGVRDLRWRARRRTIARAFAELDGWIAGLIADRQSAPGGGDLLDRLIAAEDVETGRRLNDKEVRDQLVTIFVAGHETTAVALTWAWYLLSEHPEAEARLHEALDASPETPPTYARQVMEEAMRIFPPVPRIPLRQAAVADEVCGVRIPHGAYVSISPWVIHRHRTLWADPERFDPERFAGARPPRFSYLPFGAGPRVCIGASLALNEATIVLSEVARRWRLKLAPGAAVAMRPRMTLRPMGPIGMELLPRPS